LPNLDQRMVVFACIHQLMYMTALKNLVRKQSNTNQSSNLSGWAKTYSQCLWHKTPYRNIRKLKPQTRFPCKDYDLLQQYE
jgi:hypothetical protein